MPLKGSQFSSNHHEMTRLSYLGCTQEWESKIEVIIVIIIIIIIITFLLFGLIVNPDMIKFNHFKKGRCRICWLRLMDWYIHQ
jgi:hypothetical protein